MPDATAQAPHARDRFLADADSEQADADAAHARRRIAEHYQEMARRGVEHRGAGRIE